MTKLTREFRFVWQATGLPDSSPNSWGGWGSSLQLGLQLCLQLTVAGPVRQPSGYICSIKDLDDALRLAVNQVIRRGEHLERFEQLLLKIAQEVPQTLAAAGPELAAVHCRDLRLLLNPRMSLGFSWEKSEMLSLTQQFEFSAAHRLHCRELSDAENRQLFGKCNNPRGHGHNYVVEVSVEVPKNLEKGRSWTLGAFEETVKRQVIARFDHRHLNEDVAEFRELNPSVENIAEVCFRLLENEVAPLRLTNVRIYETPKTWADRGA